MDSCSLLPAFEEKETIMENYHGKTLNIMDAADKYKGNYLMDFKDKHGKKTECRISYIPVSLCEFPDRDLVLAAVYGMLAPSLLPILMIVMLSNLMAINLNLLDGSVLVSLFLF